MSSLSEEMQSSLSGRFGSVLTVCNFNFVFSFEPDSTVAQKCYLHFLFFFSLLKMKGKFEGK